MTEFVKLTYPDNNWYILEVVKKYRDKSVTGNKIRLIINGIILQSYSQELNGDIYDFWSYDKLEYLSEDEVLARLI